MNTLRAGNYLFTLFKTNDGKIYGLTSDECPDGLLNFIESNLSKDLTKNPEIIDSIEKLIVEYNKNN